MAESKDVRTDVAVFGKHVVMTLSSAGVGSIPITLDPQAAGELAELLARNAFEAHHGRPARTDVSALQAQVQNRMTEHYRTFLARRLEVILNSMRENKDWSNAKLAGELLDVVLTKVA